MQLLFREKRADEVEQEVTQRDQFNSDEVTLTATLVREANQNSLDARSAKDKGSVRVRMSFVQPSDKTASYFDKLFKGLREHLIASGVDLGGIDFGRPNLLVIEDFGTTGLVGKWDRRDDRPFTDFWRRTGMSHKGGTSNGRWGLGKLVFSSSSRIRTFFGLTVREDDGIPLLMGQVVLANHTIADKEFAPHGFFAIPGKDGLQLPITDPAAIHEFSRAAGITRSREPGLSIVIPFILPEITPSGLIAEVVRNYFFPILTGQLVVEVEGVIIDSITFDDVASKYGKGIANPALLEFIRALHAKKDASPDVVFSEKWTGSLESAIVREELEAVRKTYNSGQLVHARFPITLRRKTGAVENSYFDLFLRRAAEGEKGEALFVRSAITVPDESRFFQPRQVFGALIASEPAITSFLGDAENPAHTRWNGSAEQLQKNWKAGKLRLSEIRNSLTSLYQLFSQAVELKDDDALLDIFFVFDEAEKKKRIERRRRDTGVPPIPPILAKPILYRILERQGGFAIKSGPALTSDKLPLTIKVKAAYDVLQGDGFKKYNSMDFDFTQNDVSISSSGAVHTVTDSNELTLEANNTNFSVEVTGFDRNRDLLVKATR